VKRQTGVWIDAEVWDAYRGLCEREKLRLAEPIEEYLRFVLRNGSVLTVLNMLKSVSSVRSGGFEDYARVLLDWYRAGERWVHVTDESEVAVDNMLLQALKDVADPELRREIREALAIEPRKQPEKMSRKRTTKKPLDREELPGGSGQARTASERIQDMQRQVASRELDPEQTRRMLETIHEIREKLRGGDKGRRRKGSGKQPNIARSNLT